MVDGLMVDGGRSLSIPGLGPVAGAGGLGWRLGLAAGGWRLAAGGWRVGLTEDFFHGILGSTTAWLSTNQPGDLSPGYAAGRTATLKRVVP